MVSWHGYFFQNTQRFWLNLRRFAFYNATIFEMFFIFLYAIEQVFLVWFAFNAKNTNELGYVVSLFAIIVLTTFALHKLLMVSRIKLLENEVKNLQLGKFNLESVNKAIIEGYGELVDKLRSQGLNISGIFNKEKRLNNE